MKVLLLENVMSLKNFSHLCEIRLIKKRMFI